jgi:hypothetical protein
MLIWKESVPKITGAMTQPLGMAKQMALTKSGEQVKKFRLTQDLSFSPTGKNVSVNDRVDMDEYVEMIYGWCLPRTIHYIMALQTKYPQTRIFVTKYDYSDVCCRIDHTASAAIQSITLFAGLTFIALRLTFGGSPNPPIWCMFPETVNNLANNMLLCKDWDPGMIHNPNQ